MKGLGSVVSILVIALCGCPAAGTAPGASADGCDQLKVAQCGLLASCEPGVFLSQYGSQENCEVREYLACAAAASASDTGLQISSILACAQAMTAESCADAIAGNTPAACQPVAGFRAQGAACAFASQCTTAYCAISPNTVCGTCQTLPGAGSSCTGLPCGPGYVCNESSWSCVAPVPTAGTCNADEPCGANSTCLGSGGSGYCAPDETQPGATCDPRHVTAPDCNATAGLTCAGSPPVCVQVTAVTSGVCGPVDGGFDVCTLGSCTPGMSGSMCAPLVTEGSSCDTVAGPECEPPAVCVTAYATTGPGTCTLPADSNCPASESTGG